MSVSVNEFASNKKAKRLEKYAEIRAGAREFKKAKAKLHAQIDAIPRGSGIITIRQGSKIIEKALVSEESIHNLAVLGLTNDEISRALSLPDGYLTGPKLDIVRKARTKLHRSIRYYQIKHAFRGNSQLLVWLGKQYLGQRDQVSAEIHSTSTNLVITPGIAAQLQAQYIETLRDVQEQRKLSVSDIPADILEEQKLAAQGGKPVAQRGESCATQGSDPIPPAPPPPRGPAPVRKPRLPKILGNF